MNTSFRTAFWAMCLGLTVPMVLFIGVEMTSGKRAARNTKVAASDHRGSLRSYWEKSASQPGRRESQPKLARPTSSSTAGAAPSSKQGSAAIAAQSRGKQPPSSAPSPETTDAKVTLGPQLESDPTAAESVAGRDRRIPAVVTGQHPSVEILEDPEAKAHDAQAIYERLDSIQQQLDRLAQTIAAQAQREPPTDPVQQTIELLRQLRQARELEEPVAPRPCPTLPETDDQKPAIKPDDKAAGEKPAKKASKSAASAPVREAPVRGPEGAAKKPRPVTRIYRPRYVSAAGLRAAVEPLLTDKIGKIGAADAAAGESGPAAAGASAPAAASALVVRDLPEVLRKIDRLVLDLDVPPLPVVIEATAITVRLNGATPNGIDLQGFNLTGQSFAITSTEGVLSAPPAESGTRAGPYSGSPQPVTDGPTLTHGFGLKCGILHGDPRAFLGVLRTLAEARRLDSWQLNTLDCQTAQLVLNDRFGPEGSTVPAATGTILSIRPTLCEGGLVQLDVQRDAGLNSAVSVSRAAALTSQVSLQEGETAVVGGFFADHLAAHIHRTPGIGEVPFVGRLFRETKMVRERAETIVLLTPRVVRRQSLEESVAAATARRKLQAAGRPVLKETAQKRDAVRPVLKATAGLPGATADGRADSGRKPVQQAATAVPKQRAEAALRRVESPPTLVPAPVTRPTAPYAPRRLPASEKAAARPIDDARPAGEPARPMGAAPDDSLDAIPVLTLPPEIELRPVVRPADEAPRF